MQRLLVTVTMCSLLLVAARQSTPLPKLISFESAHLGVVHPRISPGGETIAVSYQGALWAVARAGGAMTIERLSLALPLRDRLPNDELRKQVQNQLEAARAVYTKLAETGK